MPKLGTAKVVGNPISATTGESRSVYVMQHSSSAPRHLTSPLTYLGVSVLRADLGGASFSLLSPPTSTSTTTHTESYSVTATGKLLTKKIAELTATSLDGISGHDNTLIA